MLLRHHRRLVCSTTSRRLFLPSTIERCHVNVHVEPQNGLVSFGVYGIIHFWVSEMGRATIMRRPSRSEKLYTIIYQALWQMNMLLTVV